MANAAQNPTKVEQVKIDIPRPSDSTITVAVAVPGGEGSQVVVVSLLLSRELLEKNDPLLLNSALLDNIHAALDIARRQG